MVAKKSLSKKIVKAKPSKTLKSKTNKPAKTGKQVKATKTNKSIKTKKSSKTEKVTKKIKSTNSSKVTSKKNIKVDKKSIKQSNALERKRDKLISASNDNIDENEELSNDAPISFNFKGKEKDLVKKLKEEEDVFIEEDDDNKDPEGPKDEEEIIADEFDESEEVISGQDDIFEGVSLDDPVRMYLKEIGQYSLLTVEREKRLAKEKQDAQVLLRRKKLDEQLPIDKGREIKLTEEERKIVKRGELAQEVLIKCNLRLVVSIAKRYIGHGLSLLDLIQEGNLGLTRGIEKFDYKMGFKLSTYVTWWIRQAVSRALADQSKTIRIPVHMVETINRLNKEKKKLTAELGYEPSIKQLAKGMKMSEEKVEEVIQIAMDPISLDKPVGDEDDSIVADFIADQNVISPETNAERVMLKEKIQGLLDGLKDREKKVLVLRFGIEDDHPRTLEEVGKELKVTRERIRQIEDKALRKLKIRARSLQDIIK
ncbi:MAG: sigma-70 family RNA polymerase sigma factor [Lachnospiraceae bacterium]|nr:sigma-70 family RNA polymerase sigma factor [Lachnospiraceae bacterium]